MAEDEVKSLFLSTVGNLELICNHYLHGLKWIKFRFECTLYNDQTTKKYATTKEKKTWKKTFHLQPMYTGLSYIYIEEHDL